MNKILIVEDNEISRRGLCENIPWSENNIQILGAAVNGENALEFIEQQVPDVIITDIVMPLMDGLKLAEVIYQKYPFIKVIVLSGYDEFDYVQKALKFNVFDYILKPVDYDLLVRTVKSCLEEKRLEELFREQVKKSVPVLREKFLLRLAEGYFESESLREEAGYLGIDISSNVYQCMVFDIDHLQEMTKRIRMEELEVLILKVMDIVSHCFSDHKLWLFHTRQHSIGAILGSDLAADEVQEAVYENVEIIKAEVEKRCGFTITAALGETVSSLTQVFHSFAKAQEALEYRFLLGYNKTIHYRDFNLTQDTSDVVKFPFSIEENLLKKIRLGNQQEVLGCLAELEEYFNVNKPNKEYVKIVVTGLATKVFQVLLEMGISTDKLTAIKPDDYMRLMHLQTQREIIDEFVKLLTKACKIIEDARLNQNQQIIYKVKSFLEKSYMKEDLNLNDIARVVSLSPAYFSSIFKKETGVNLSDYITQIRMEKAQELLCNSDLKVFEVGTMVGYPNSYYFSSSFKKYVGVSPKEYREKARDDS